MLPFVGVEVNLTETHKSTDFTNVPKFFNNRVYHTERQCKTVNKSKQNLITQNSHHVKQRAAVNV